MVDTRAARALDEGRRAGGPRFGNQLMTPTLQGRNLTLTLIQATSGAGGDRLTTALERSLTEEHQPTFGHRTDY